MFKPFFILHQLDTCDARRGDLEYFYFKQYRLTSKCMVKVDFNFVVIDWGMADVPPILFVAIRFVAVVLPAVFLVARPAAPWRMPGLAPITDRSANGTWRRPSLATAIAKSPANTAEARRRW